MGTDTLKNKAQSIKNKVGIPCGDDLVKCFWRLAFSNHKEQSKKYKVGIPCGDDLVKCFWRFASSNHKEQSKKQKDGSPCGDDLVKCSSSGLIPSGLTLRVMWPRRESSRARPRPSLAFRRGARLLPSGWPRRESNPDLAFRKRLFYPLNYSANISTLYSMISTLLSLLSLWHIPITMPHQVVSLQPVRENLHMFIF